MADPAPDALADPWYRAIAADRWVEASMPAAHWLQVGHHVAGLAANAHQARQGAGFFKRTFSKGDLPPLPPSPWGAVVMPLVRVLAEDVAPHQPIGLRVDLRGTAAPGKLVFDGKAPMPGGADADTKLWHDPWLAVGASLVDGSRLELTVVDRLRERRYWKRSRSGKRKLKHKKKLTRRIQVEVAGHRRKHVLLVPQPPPAIAVYAKPGASRPTATARVTVTLPEPSPQDELRRILLVVGEAHRHLAAAPEAA